MKLLLPKKIKAENLLYVVKLPEEFTWIATYKDNTAIVYNVVAIPTDDEVDQWFNTLTLRLLELNLRLPHNAELCNFLHKPSGVWLDFFATVTTEQGVWVAGKKGDFSFSSSNTCLWQIPENLDNSHETKEYDKSTGAELADVLGFPARLRYKQKLQITTTDDFAFVQYPHAAHYYWIKPSDESTGVLHAVTKSRLDKSITVVDADDASVFGLIDVWTRSSDVLTVDTETFDPEEPNEWKALVGWLGKLRLLQIYSPVLDSTLIIDFGGRGQNTSESVRFAIGEYLQTSLEGKTLEFQNALFDLLFLDYQLGLTVYKCQIKDSMLMSKSLWAGIGLLSHSLEAISTRLGLGTPDKSLQKSDFGVRLVPAQLNYGAEDVKITHNCVKELEKRLNRVGENWEFANIDNDYIHVAHMIRRFGMWIDKQKLDEVKQLTQAYYDDKTALWKELSDYSPSVSSQKLVPWINDKLLSTSMSPVKDAQGSTLKGLVMTIPELRVLLDAKAAKKRLDYLNGLELNISYRNDGCSTPGIQVSARQGLGRTSQGDMVRGKNVAGNQQNPGKESKDFPELKDYRCVFAAPPTHKFISSDLQAAHSRLAIKYSGCKLGEARLKPGEDIHTSTVSFIVQECEKREWVREALMRYETAMKIKKIDFKNLESISEKMLLWADSWAVRLPEFTSGLDVLKAVYKEFSAYRKLGKTCFYAAINIAGAARVQKALEKEGIFVDLDTVKSVLAAIWKSIGEIKDYAKAKQKEANTTTYVICPDEINLLSPEAVDWEEISDEDAAEFRKRPVDFAKLLTPSGLSRFIPRYYQTGMYGNKYVSVSISDVSATIWQAGEAKMTKLSQIRFLQEYIIPNGYHLPDSTGFPSVWINGFAHDELLCCARNDLADTAAEVMFTIMCQEWEKVCPGISGLEGAWQDTIGQNWSETK